MKDIDADSSLISIEIVGKYAVQHATRPSVEEAKLFARNYSCQRNIELVTFTHDEREYTFRDGAMFESTA